MQQRVRGSIVEKILRPPGNSPSRWHLTRCLLLCSGITIHDLTGNVNTYFYRYHKSIYPFGLCRIFLSPAPPFSLSFLLLTFYNDTT